MLGFTSLLNYEFLVIPYTDASRSRIIPLAYTFSKPILVPDIEVPSWNILNKVKLKTFFTYKTMYNYTIIGWIL
jgi:hypothetical protein